MLISNPFNFCLTAILVGDSQVSIPIYLTSDNPSKLLNNSRKIRIDIG